MIVLGLAGQAGSGKTTVAEYLVRTYGFIRFGFAAALYNEVAAAYGHPDDSMLRDRRYKEAPTEALALGMCSSEGFKVVAREILKAMHPYVDDADTIPLSSRWVLQHWGTNYRRAQDENYWLIQADKFINGVRSAVMYPEHRAQLFVCDDVRFENERQFIRGHTDGGMWHIFRRGAKPVALHVSENPLEIWSGERELYNNDSISRLHYGIDLLMRSSARFVAVEPELPMEENK